MNIAPLFPTPVVFFELNRELTKKELKFLSNQEFSSNVYNVTSSNSKILEDKKMKHLKKWIQECFNQAFQEIYCPKFSVKLKITQSWLNYNKPNEAHHKHVHPNSFLSGVFYAQAEKEKDNIVFYKKTEYPQIQFEQSAFHDFNSNERLIHVNTNMLVVFPSSLEHSVNPVNVEKVRISLAINTFPVGIVGNSRSLTGLQILDVK